MSDFWKSIEDAALPVALGVIPLAGAFLRSWLKARTAAWEDKALDAWAHADDLASSAPGSVDDAQREEMATRALQGMGLSLGKAQKLARRTRPEPIPLSQPAPDVADAFGDGTPRAERITLPGIPPPRSP